MISTTASNPFPPIIVPTLPETGPTPLPAGSTTTTTPSGLIVVHHEFDPVTRGSGLVLADKPLTGDAALDAAKAAHAELAARSGAVAADVVYGETLAQVQRIRDDELRHQAVEALLAGDLARAAELISRA